MSEDPSYKYIDQLIDEVLSRVDQKDPRRRIIINSYEGGDVTKSAEYLLYYGTDEESKKAYRAQLETALADAAIQLRMMEKIFEFDSYSILRLGAKRLEEYRNRLGYTGKGER